MIAGLEYGLKKPQSLIVCVPLAAQLVQYIQLSRIPKPTNLNEMFAYADKVDPINTYHAIGALIRAVAWVALSVFTGNPWISFCSFPALYQAYRSSQNLTHSYSEELPRDNRLQVAQPNANGLAVVPAKAPAAQPGWLSRIGTVLSKVLAMTKSDPEKVNAMLDRAMAEIKRALLNQTNYPNKTLVAVRIQAGGFEPFMGAMNLNLTEAPRTLAWHATLHRRMHEYLTKNWVTNFEIVLAVGTSSKAGHYDIRVIEKALELTVGGEISDFTHVSYKDFPAVNAGLLSDAHPALLPAINHLEDVFGNNAIPNAW